MADTAIMRHQIRELTALSPEAEEYLKASKARSTLKAYQSDWSHFVEWAGSSGADPIPASSQAVADYLVYMAESCKVSTIARRRVHIQGATGRRI